MTPSDPESAFHESTGDIAAVFARCFRGADGDRALEHLRRVTVERRLAPDCAESELRHLEGQRHIALAIQRLVARGRDRG